MYVHTVRRVWRIWGLSLKSAMSVSNVRQKFVCPIQYCNLRLVADGTAGPGHCPLLQMKVSPLGSSSYSIPSLEEAPFWSSWGWLNGSYPGVGHQRFLLLLPRLQPFSIICTSYTCFHLRAIVLLPSAKNSLFSEGRMASSFISFRPVII